MKKVCLIFLNACLSTVTTFAQQTDTVKVNVHNHQMTLYVSGKGTPTVILEAGGGSNHKTWQLVQLKIAADTKVVSYDRPGYLNSDSCSSPRDAIRIATELKEALTKANIPPPYIFSGWSYGGSLIRVFAGLYPKDVVGMVLVDPAPEEVYARGEKEFPDLMKEEEKYVKEILASKTRQGEREEMRLFDSSMNQARRSDKLHTTPTTLLIAAGKAAGGQDRDTTNPLNRIWVEELVKWAKTRPNLKYEIINSGHHIARFKPDTVIHAIRDHINQYQASTIRRSATPYKKPTQLPDGIKTATLKDVGLNEKLLQAMSDSIVNGNYPNIHSVLIMRNNKLVYEKYFPGTDVIRGKGYIGFKDHQRDTLHDIRSASKSFVSAAVMIAVGQGKIKSLEQRVFDYFPQYAKFDTGMKRQITIQQVLNMTAGLAWNEEIPYSDPMNSEVRMNNSPNAIEFVLSQDMADIPGEKYNYSGGCSQLLAELVEKATGLPVDKFLELYLFKHLGVVKYTWVKNRDGKPSGASGLRMRSRDMAKFGLLYLNDGKWNGKQIIPEEHVSQTLKSQVSTPYTDSIAPFLGYSNQFWIPTELSMGKPISFVRCQGNGGQIINIDRSTGIVAVVTGGNYNKQGMRKTAWDIYIDFVYPSIIK